MGNWNVEMLMEGAESCEMHDGKRTPAPRRCKLLAMMTHMLSLSCWELLVDARATSLLPIAFWPFNAANRLHPSIT